MIWMGKMNDVDKDFEFVKQKARAKSIWNVDKIYDT